MGTDFLVRKLDLLKVEKPGGMAKLQTTNQKIEFLTFSFLTYNYYYNFKGEEGSYYSKYKKNRPIYGRIHIDYTERSHNP